MGYYTYFNFCVQDFETLEYIDLKKQDEIFEELNKKYEITDVDDRDFTAHWYDIDENMKEFSKKYPEYLFKIYGEGEDGSLDTYIKYFHNGKMQFCQGSLVYDEINKDVLK